MTYFSNRFSTFPQAVWSPSLVVDDILYLGPEDGEIWERFWKAVRMRFYAQEVDPAAKHLVRNFPRPPAIFGTFTGT
jgi:hypothetical protein